MKMKLMNKHLLLILLGFGLIGCATTYDEDYIYKQYRSLMDEPQPKQVSLEELRAAKLKRKKNKCIEYGFKENSDGMGFCLIELDKLEALKIANKNQETALKKQQEDAERQRISEAWIRFGNAMSNLGGINQESVNRTSIYILSSSYISGLNKICIYTLGVQKATHTISSGSICPATMKF